MTHRGLVCLLLGALAWGQAAKTPPSGGTQPANQSSPQPAAAPATPAPPKPELPPDAVVMTIPGACENPPADKTPENCKTDVTRSEFEALMDAIAPNVPAAARRQLANRYAMGVVMSQEAHRLGLDKGPKFEERMKLARMQTLAQAYGESVQDTAGHVPDKDIQDYYDKNKSGFDEVEMQRIFIPLTKTLPASKIKLTPAQTQKREDDAKAAMKIEAGKIHARAVAGEDFAKLEQEAFTFAGSKGKPPQTNMGKIRHNTLPPAHSSAFDLKTGTVSPLITDLSGYFIYKPVSRDTLTLDKAHDEIVNMLKAERMQQTMQDLQKSATPKLNDDYFVSTAAPKAPMGKVENSHEQPDPDQ